MNTFTGWRSVGRAMRWARQQDRVQFERTRLDDAGQILFTWTAGEESVYVDFVSGGDPAELTFETVGASINHAYFDDGGTVLRVLAVLGLVPTELAEVRDERYGRCVKCKQLLRFATGHQFWGDRWVHVYGDAWMSRIDGHVAEVAE
ncbi:hypothetical protein [Actinoplanes palleronii]|uniref:Uncharacterized protein n=1 Tax=Actinoplanes palleronii TaxID=113570 RepID=A0ABQ4BJB7_9ACTN|nr:hypothetical protein [Actinoplanes palleronii]GIE70777.1 hypothetical protein Apa02nite_068850 [Actinoplanes palleronii]